MNRMTTALIAASLSGLLAMPAQSHEPAKKPAQGHSASHAGHSAGSMELHRIMMQGQKMPMPMSGNVDKDFAAMMTMHHQQAIQMADVLLKHGRNAELKALARKMQEEQRKEIKQLAPFAK